MASSLKAEWSVNVLKDIFQQACQPHSGTGKEGHFAEALSQGAQQAARSNNHNDCEAVLSFVISCLDSHEGFTVLNNVIFEVFSPLVECCHASRVSEDHFKYLIGLIAARCTPREVIALFLAALDDSAGDEVPEWRSSDTALLQVLPGIKIGEASTAEEPHGPHGWHDPSGVLRNAEPICAALNLSKLLLLRAKHGTCVPGFFEREQLGEMRERCLKPLRAGALHSLAELKAADDATSSEQTDAVLALERVLLVLTWVLGSVEEHMGGLVR